MRTVVYAYQNTCDITVAYFAASVVLLVAETVTGRNGTANATHKVKNTLAYRFFGLLRGLPFSASRRTPPPPCRENPDI